MKRKAAERLKAALNKRGLSSCQEQMERAFKILCTCFTARNKLLVCGNGGSAADSEHMVGELMKGFHTKRQIPKEHREKLMQAFPDDGKALAEKLQGAIPAISLVSQTSLCTSIANDVSADMIFAQQVYGYGRPGDVLIGISTSGNASNVINALKTARAFGLKTIGLTGREGGRMGDLCDVTIRVPAVSTPEIQVYHLQVYHTLCAMLEAEFF